MPSEKRPPFCGLHLSALTRRGLVTVSRTRFVNHWFSSDKPRTALIWHIFRLEDFNNNRLCHWKIFWKKFRCPVLSVIKLVTTLKHPKISKGFWFYSNFPRLHTLFPTFPNNNFRTEQNHSFSVCRLFQRQRHQSATNAKIPTLRAERSEPGYNISVYRQVSTYLCLYVCMYKCTYRPTFIKKS